MSLSTQYIAFNENDYSTDNERNYSDIVSPITNDENITPTQRYQLARVLEIVARNLRLGRTRTYVGADNENYCLPEKRENPITNHLERRNIPKRISENIFIITFVWQLICVMGLEAVDALTHHQLDREKPYYIAGIVVMVIFQMSNLILCLSVTVKLFKQYKHKNTSMKFLLYAYVFTLFLFGGMYTFIAWIYPAGFTGIDTDRAKNFRALDLYSQLIFMSISTGTLCGASKVTASHILSELMMSFQMLLSFLYFASIISEVLNPSITGIPGMDTSKGAGTKSKNTKGWFLSKNKKTKKRRILDV